MSAVDVLAVMDEAMPGWECCCEPDRVGDMRAAGAAVAELIAQRDMMANALATYRKAGVGNSTDFSLQIEASKLAAIALARCGGAK